MQRIDLHLQVSDPMLYVCRLLKKVVRERNLKAVVYSRDIQLLKNLYQRLWTFEDLTFISHVWSQDPMADEAEVVFGNDLSNLPSRPVIVLLDREVPDDWQNALARFERGVDIVSADPEEVALARVRWKIYHQAGLTPQLINRG